LKRKTTSDVVVELSSVSLDTARFLSCDRVKVQVQTPHMILVPSSRVLGIVWKSTSTVSVTSQSPSMFMCDVDSRDVQG
jgi:hypothetical protein